MLLLEDNIRKYHFQSQAELTVDGMDDKEEMQNTDVINFGNFIWKLSILQESFDIMGFTQQEKDDLYKLTAVCMHMGEMKFKQRPREEQAEVDDVTGWYKDTVKPLIVDTPI